MGEIAFVVAGRLAELTGGHLFDRHIVEGLRGRGRTVRLVEIEPGGSERLSALPEGMATAVDHIALPALAEALPAAARRLRLVAFVHHRLADEAGLAAAERRRLAALETDLLPLFRGVLCPSRMTADAVAALGVPAGQIAVTPPGTAKPAAPPPLRPGPVRRLLSVANVIPRKGHDVLVAALSRIADLDWTLDCIGALDRDPGYASAIREEVTAAGLAHRVALLGALPPATVARHYAAADAFVSASHLEGYGMACAEAMAWGLPQVSTAAGAVPEVVPPDAGLLVPPGDPDRLAAALRSLIKDPSLATHLAAGARMAGARLPDWPAAVALWEVAFSRFAEG